MTIPEEIQELVDKLDRRINRVNQVIEDLKEYNVFVLLEIAANWHSKTVAINPLFTIKDITEHTGYAVTQS